MSFRRTEGGFARLSESGLLRIPESIVLAGWSGALAVTEAADTLVAAFGVPTFDTWNPADKLDVTLSNADLTATIAAGAGYRGARSIGGRTTGKLHFECTVNNQGANFGFGLANTSAPLNSYIGSDNNSIGFYPSGNIWRGNAIVGTVGGTFGNGAILEVEVDLDADTARFRRSSGTSWSSDISIVALGAGALHVFWTTDQTGEQITLNTGGTAFDGALSSGYSAWG